MQFLSITEQNLGTFEVEHEGTSYSLNMNHVDTSL